MQKFILASTIPAFMSLTAFAAPAPLVGANVMYYKTIATSAGISVTSSGPISMFYVNNASNGASNTAEASIMLVKWSEWYIDTISGDFSGNLYYGNYKVQANQTLPVIDGRQSLTGVMQSFSGTATWTTATHLSYNYLNPTRNGGGASTQTENSYSCINGQTSPLAKICGTFSSASRAWEGLSFDFDFFNGNYNFSGVLTATDTGGSGASLFTTSANWQIDAIDPPIVAPVPIPAAAWLFGSALIGLAGANRRKLKAR
jgi:hypothetical protein